MGLPPTSMVGGAERITVAASIDGLWRRLGELANS